MLATQTTDKYPIVIRAYFRAKWMLLFIYILNAPRKWIFSSWNIWVIFVTFQNRPQCKKYVKDNKHNSLHFARKYIKNYSMSPSWIWSDKITNERVARVGYNHFISNKSEWNNCLSKFSNRVLPPIFISTILQSVRKEHQTSGHTRPDSSHFLIIT